MRLWSGQRGFRIALVVLMAVTALGTFNPAGVDAANQLTSTLVRIANMHASSTTVGSVCVVAHSSGNMDYVQVTFPTNFTISTTLANWTTTISAPSSPGTGSNYWPNNGGAAIGFPNALTATNVTGQTVTWQFTTQAALSTSVFNCFDWTNANAITSTGAATASETGTVDLENSTPTVVDQGSYAVSVLTNANTIVVTATVPPIFEFTLSGNTDAFGTLDNNSINATSGVTASVITNAKGGWYMWVSSANQALTSASSSGSIPSVGWNSDAPTTFTANTTTDYGLSVTKVNGTTLLCSTANLSVAPEYDTVGHGGTGGDLTANFTEIGQCTGAPSNGDGMKLTEEATITPVTPAATDYTDTLTVTGAGSF